MPRRKTQTENIKGQQTLRSTNKDKPADAFMLIDISDMPDLDFITRDDADELMQLLYIRAGSNKLNRKADKIQATSAIAAIFSIQAIYKVLQKSQITIGSIEDLQKLIASINRAVAAANSCFKALGIDSNTREEEVQVNDLSEMLLSINLESSQPPLIQKEYLRMKDDIQRTEDGSLPSEEDEVREAMQAVRQPISVYNEATEKIKSRKLVKPEDEEIPVRTL